MRPLHCLLSFVCFLVVMAAACRGTPELARMAAMGRAQDLRPGAPVVARPAGRPTFLVIGIDGMKRKVLYDLLQTGALPGLTALLGGRSPDGGLAHAHLDRSMLAGLPAITIVGWSSIFTGVAPAVHGVTGNEFFIREERRFAAPLPGTFEDPKPALATYTESYVNDLLQAPTLYERLRQTDPGMTMWVSVNQCFRGADRLLIAQRRAIVGKVYASAKSRVEWESFGRYEERDHEVLRNVIHELENDDHAVPDLLTLYVSGTDGYAHVAPEGPDDALRRMLTGDLDASFGRLADALDRRGALRDRYVVLVADHGHSPVLEDGSTLLGTSPESAPGPLTAAGFRIRPFRLDVDADDDFQSVLAYQGPLAYVYLADRSTCPRPGERCHWTRPPRFDADVLPVAEAYYQAGRTGRSAPALRGAIDLVLTRRPRPYAENDLPFEIYVGHGKLVPLGNYLRRHPRRDWVAVESRLRELAVGRYGERAGDVVLLAKNGDGDGPAGRYYFNGSAQRSVHGSPSRQDSEVPLIVANRSRSAEELRMATTSVLGKRSFVRQVTDLVLRLDEE
ncbi:MAG: alkaline phosphatase family protein [Candidatus Binatia bacterium]